MPRAWAQPLTPPVQGQQLPFMPAVAHCLYPTHCSLPASAAHTSLGSDHQEDGAVGSCKQPGKLNSPGHLSPHLHNICCPSWRSN